MDLLGLLLPPIPNHRLIALDIQEDHAIILIVIPAMEQKFWVAVGRARLDAGELEWNVSDSPVEADAIKTEVQGFATKSWSAVRWAFQECRLRPERSMPLVLRRPELLGVNVILAAVFGAPGSTLP